MSFSARKNDNLFCFWENYRTYLLIKMFEYCTYAANIGYRQKHSRFFSQVVLPLKLPSFNHDDVLFSQNIFEFRRPGLDISLDLLQSKEQEVCQVIDDPLGQGREPRTCFSWKRQLYVQVDWGHGKCRRSRSFGHVRHLEQYHNLFSISYAVQNNGGILKHDLSHLI